MTIRTFHRISLISLLISTAAAADLPKYEPIYLWPEGAPGAKGTDEKDKPSLALYPAPKDKANGTAVIIAPGGGYHVHAIDHEGAQVAKVLNKQGITAFVLKYRLKPQYQPDVALLDAKRAVRWVRLNAKDYNLSINRIGMLGFSAGGHLASAVGTDFDDGDEKAGDAIEKQSSRPDFLCLCYPVTSGDLLKGYATTHDKVTEKTPPTFIWFTSEDNLNPEHGIRFYQALRKAKVEAEIHIYSRGQHGLGLAPGDPAASQWPAQFDTFLRNTGNLTDAKRVAVSGRVTVDGKGLHRGWVTLIPQDENLPISNAYITEKADGKFTIPATHGPCPGQYRVVVNEVAQQFLTVPSMEDARTFNAEGTVEVTDGRQAIEVKVVSK